MEIIENIGEAFEKEALEKSGGVFGGQTKEKSLDAIYTKVFGISYRQDVVGNLKEGEELFLEREKDNQYDKNAIKISTFEKNHLGYVSRELALKIAPEMDKGIKFICRVRHLTGILPHQTKGCNIIIQKL